MRSAVESMNRRYLQLFDNERSLRCHGRPSFARRETVKEPGFSLASDRLEDSAFRPGGPHPVGHPHAAPVDRPKGDGKRARLQPGVRPPRRQGLQARCLSSTPCREQNRRCLNVPIAQSTTVKEPGFSLASDRLEDSGLQARKCAGARSIYPPFFPPFPRLINQPPLQKLSSFSPTVRKCFPSFHDPSPPNLPNKPGGLHR